MVAEQVTDDREDREQVDHEHEDGQEHPYEVPEVVEEAHAPTFQLCGLQPRSARSGESVSDGSEKVGEPRGETPVLGEQARGPAEQVGDFANR